MPPNLQDIADAAGVGKSTVSLALRNDPRLRPETRARIQKFAREMGYKRNAAVSQAMAQIRGRDQSAYQANLGLLNVSHDADALKMTWTFREWMRGCHDRGKDLGYGLDVFWLFESGLTTTKLMKILESRNIQGVLVAGILDRRRLPEEFREIGARFPTVAIGVQASQPRLHCCLNDQYHTVMRAVKQVKESGYRNPGIVISDRVDKLVDYRFTGGFYAAMNEGPGKMKTGAIFEFVEEKKAAFLKWYEKAAPDVILTLHDQLLDWLRDEGVKVPGDVGLVHLDLSPDHEGWAGMDQNSVLVGARALDILVGEIQRNESGIPAVPSSVLIESSWRGKGTIAEQ